MTEGPKKASKKFSECTVLRPAVCPSQALCFFITVLFLFLFLPMPVSLWRSVLLGFHVTISLSLWPQYLSHSLAGLALHLCAAVVSVSVHPDSFSPSVCTSWSLALFDLPHGWAAPCLWAWFHRVSGQAVLLGWGGVCACHAMLSYVPTSSGFGTQSNLTKGHTHPLLFPQVRPLPVPEICSPWFLPSLGGVCVCVWCKDYDYIPQVKKLRPREFPKIIWGSMSCSWTQPQFPSLPHYSFLQTPSVWDTKQVVLRQEAVCGPPSGCWHNFCPME